MNILFFTHLTSEFPELILPYIDKYPEFNFIFAKSREEYQKSIKIANVLITGYISDEDIVITQRLKLIIVPFTGVSQLNLKLLGKKGIKVANSHGNALVVAERAIALALACCGRVVEFHNDQIKGNWHRTGDKSRPFDYWFSITGKPVTILGTGEIGRSIAKLLSGFNCDIKGFRKTTTEVPEYFGSVTNNIKEALSFGELVFVSLPITDETTHIINSTNISLLNGKYIINIGRGELIEEDLLYTALKDGSIKGAGIDAWYEYPSKNKKNIIGSKYPFHKIPSVVMSPHASSHTPEGKMGQLNGALEVLDQYLANGWIKNHITEDY